jgi:cardiolipin synthase
MTSTGVEILATGERFIGKGFRAIEPSIEELIKSAKNEIQIATFLFKDTARPVLDLLRAAAERGVKLTIAVNQLKEQPKEIVQRLGELGREYPHVRIVDFVGVGGILHAKVLVADRKVAIVGSANFTWHGFVTNHELAVLVRGQPAWDLASLLDRLQ